MKILKDNFKALSQVFDKNLPTSMGCRTKVSKESFCLNYSASQECELVSSEFLLELKNDAFNFIELLRNSMNEQITSLSDKLTIHREFFKNMEEALTFPVGQVTDTYMCYDAGASYQTHELDLSYRGLKEHDSTFQRWGNSNKNKNIPIKNVSVDIKEHVTDLIELFRLYNAEHVFDSINK